LREESIRSISFSRWGFGKKTDLGDWDFGYETIIVLFYFSLKVKNINYIFFWFASIFWFVKYKYYFFKQKYNIIVIMEK
jgi:hypothetical protein